MRAIVVEGKERVLVRDVPEPRADGRALVAVRRGGICATDLKVVLGQIPASYPVILGHEVVGMVVESGRLGLVAVGTRVLIDPVGSCGYCRECRADRTYLCGSGALMGRDVDGGFAELVAVEETRLHALPAMLSDDEAVLLQVLGTCLHAQTLIDVFPGQTAVVLGLGVTGLLHVQLLAARGIRRVIGVTRSEWKRDLAKQMGATATCPPDQAAKTVDELTGGAGADLVIESAGAATALGQAVDLAGLGAVIISFGMISESRAELPLYQIYFKELRILGSRAARPRDYARTVDLAASGCLQLRPLLSRSYPFEEAPAAVHDWDPATTLKVTLEVA